MLDRLTALARGNGAPREISGNRVISLGDTSSVLLVESGHVDIFAVEMRDGEPVGRRHHVTSVEAGGLVFGFDVPAAEPQTGLVAAGAPGTRVGTLRVPQLRQLGGPEAPALAPVIDRWIGDATAGVLTNLHPRHVSVEARAGTTMDLAAGGSIRTHEGVLWVRRLEGGTQFCGRDDVILPGADIPFPLADRAWLVARDAAKLDFMDTAAWLARDGEWAALASFHRFIFECIVANLGRDLAEDRRRVLEREKNDRDCVEGALVRFASVLETSAAARTLAAVEDTRAQYFSAAGRVARELAITLQTPPNWKRGAGTPGRDDALEDIARASRFRTRRVILAGQWWKEDHGPLLGYAQEGHVPVALVQISGRRYETVDPRTGARTVVNAAVAATLDPFADMFYRTFPERALSSLDLIVFGVKNAGNDMTMVILMAMAMGLLGLVTPLVTGYVFDTVLPNAQLDMLGLVSLALLASAVASLVYTATRSIAILRVQGRVDLHLQSAMWDRLLSLPVPFFRDYTAGDLARRVMGITEIQNLLSGTTISTVIGAVFSGFSFLLLFYYSWRLALIGCGLILAEMVVVFTLAWLQVRHQRRLVEIQGRISGLVLQFLTGISKLRVSGTEDRAFAVWSERFTAQKKVAYTAGEIRNLTSTFHSAYPTLCNIVIYWFMVYFAAASPMSTGSFLAFSSAFSQFLAASLDMVTAVMTVLAVVPTWERARPIVATLPEVDEGKNDPGDLGGAIEVGHVNFRYREDGPRILHDVSFRIEPGEFVALVGPSGSGKSTLFRIMLGFEKAESGTVYYDGQDLEELDVRSVRRQVGVVLQDGAVMSGDIFTNIVGSSRLTMDDAWEAARMAGLEEDIRSLPMGMHTVVSQGGRSFSGGQRQRMMIARAIVNRPRILFFDEATSALDNRTQAIVSESLEKLRATRVVIAHRLSTVINADRIFVLVDGHLVESGTFRELMKLNGHFTQLARRQMLAPSDEEEAGSGVPAAVAATDNNPDGSAPS